MELMIQTLVVAVVVLVSTVLAAWRLTPARTKLRLLDGMKPDMSSAIGRWLTKLRKGVAEELAHGCGACSKSPDHVQKHAAVTKR